MAIYAFADLINIDGVWHVSLPFYEHSSAYKGVVGFIVKGDRLVPLKECKRGINSYLAPIDVGDKIYLIEYSIFNTSDADLAREAEDDVDAIWAWELTEIDEDGQATFVGISPMMPRWLTLAIEEEMAKVYNVRLNLWEYTMRS